MTRQVLAVYNVVLHRKHAQEDKKAIALVFKKGK